jgi:agmatine deiminase
VPRATSRKVVLGLVQSKPAENLRANLESGIRLVGAAAIRGARIVCLPELYRSRYFPQAERARSAHLAQTAAEATGEFRALAKRLGVVVILPFFELAGSRFYNSAAVIDADGRLLGVYRKVHIPHDPLFWEKNYFEPGDGGFKVFKTRYADIAPLICYDQWFPEAARGAALAGAQILFYPTAIGFIRGYKPPEGDWREAWTTIQRSHAIANSVHVAAVNRVGVEGKLRFWGSSFVADPFGNIVKLAGDRKEEVLVAEIDLSRNREFRDSWGFMRNRRPDAYRPLLKPVAR